MKHKKKILGLLLFLCAIGIIIYFPDTDLYSYLCGGLFGGGFVFLFGIDEKVAKKPTK